MQGVLSSPSCLHLRLPRHRRQCAAFFNHCSSLRFAPLPLSSQLNGGSWYITRSRSLTSQGYCQDPAHEGACQGPPVPDRPSTPLDRCDDGTVPVTSSDSTRPENGLIAYPCPAANYLIPHGCPEVRTPVDILSLWALVGWLAVVHAIRLHDENHPPSTPGRFHHCGYENVGAIFSGLDHEVFVWCLCLPGLEATTWTASVGEEDCRKLAIGRA